MQGLAILVSEIFSAFDQHSSEICHWSNKICYLSGSYTMFMTHWCTSFSTQNYKIGTKVLLKISQIFWIQHIMHIRIIYKPLNYIPKSVHTVLESLGVNEYDMLAC